MIYAFDGIELDTERYEVRRDLEVVAVEPQVFDVLAHLVTHRDRVVTKTELLDSIWGDRFVGESALSSRIKAARRAVGDDGNTQWAIKTVHGRGFRFVAEVTETPAPTSPPSGQLDPAGLRLSQEVRFTTSPDGVRLAYASSGDGPPLVKAGNWLTHLRKDWESPVWGHWLRDLSARFRYVHYDVRGTGLSDWDVDDMSLETWLSDLEAVVDAAGLDRFALMGLSQGGAVATTFAARHPDRVSHLILYGAYAVGRGARARTESETREAEMMLDIVQTVWGREGTLFRRMFATQFMPEGTPELWDAFDAHQRLTTSPDNAPRVFGVAYDLDLTDTAPQVQCPTLVLHVTDDRRVPIDQGELLAALIPGARFVELPGCNHLLLEGEKAWPMFLDAIEGFVSGER